MLVKNGPVTTSHKPNVHFVHIQCSINFASLVSIPNAGPTILCTHYYLKLPQTTTVIVNGIGCTYNLMTWHGATNLATLLLSADICNLILRVCLQDGPIALLQANFNISKADIDASGLLEKIMLRF